ncbi:MAG TPA: hypothetical protein DCE42_21435 [Myxococcales bacterium]|nr:hypothetical protein [Deltaproteobacteria bacterium]MBU49437.1 hypothetical protein [Deltaproteobacteria bacterium]HAA57343.1 hypothetical protein [Myxococcales bacterium]
MSYTTLAVSCRQVMCFLRTLLLSCRLFLGLNNHPLRGLLLYCKMDVKVINDMTLLPPVKMTKGTTE